MTARTGLTSSAVTQIVKRLIAADLVGEFETQGTKSPGRNRVNVALTGHGLCSLGLIVRRHDVLWAICTLDGTPLAVQETALAGNSAADRLDLTLSSLQEEIQRSGRRLVAAGIGLPTFSGTRLQKKEYLAEIRTRLGVPCQTSNNSTYPALQEERTFLGQRPPAFLFVFAGGGIGGAVVRRRPNGELPDIHVVEVGHVGIDPEGAPCICGNRGCVEMSVSPVALARQAGIPSTGPADEDLLQIPEALTGEATDRLAYALASIANVLDVSHVVVGGYGEAVLRHLYGRLPERLRGSVTPGGEPVTVRFSSMGRRSCVVGAAVGALHDFGEPVTQTLVTTA